MADAVTFQVPNLAQFLKEVRELPQRVKTEVLKGACGTGASVMRKKAIQLAPIWTGADSELMGMIGRKAKKFPKNHPPPGTLKNAIYQVFMPEMSSATRTVFKVDVRRGKNYRSTGKDGINRDAFYALWVEYGHYTRSPKNAKQKMGGTRASRQKAGIAAGTIKWVPAQPFMQPAFDSTKEQALKAMQTYIDERLPDAVAVNQFIRTLR